MQLSEDITTADTSKSSGTITSKLQAKIVDITPERDKGILKEVQKEGTGDARPLKGDTVYMHYVGRLEDGTELDSSRKGSEKFQYILDSNDASTLKAWELALPTMQRGEVAVYTCQPNYAYGKKGLPPKVPPNAVVVYEIELFSWRGEDVSENKDGGVLKSRMKNGEGVNPPKDGAVCSARLIGYHNGRQFLDRNTKFTLGEGYEINIVEGVEQGLRSMKSGERAMFRVKARYAYGEEGHKMHGVPPNADVDFDVELESYDPFKAGWMLDDDERLSAAATARLKGIKRYEEGRYKFAARHFSTVVEYLVEEDTLIGDEKRKRDALMLSAYLNVAQCYLKLEKNLEAVHSCDEALKMEPRNEKALYRRATAQMNMSNFEEAIEDYKALLEKNENNTVVRQQIVLARQRLTEMKQREKSMYHAIFDKKS